MRIFRLTTAFLILFVFTANSQNIRIGGDGTSGADPSAILELDGSNSQGFLVPQMTETQRNAFGSTLGASANNGEAILIYQTDGDVGLYYWEGDRWLKYKPFGFTGVVGTNWDTITDMYQFSTEGTGFTATNLGLGNYQVSFAAPFNTYPTITMSSEANQFPLPDDLPVPDVTCTPSFTANCTADFNSDQCEAVRIVSTVEVGGTTETQVIQNGVGFLPVLNSNTIPGGYTNDTSTPEFVSAIADGNGCSWPQSWMTGTPPLSTGAPPAAANQSLLAGGCWGLTTDCILQAADPCVVQNGGGNYGRYLPDGINASVNSFCNNIYHPAETTNGTAALDTQQDNQVSLRIGNAATDHFEIYVESSPHWSDAMAAYIDWNRDGDFADVGEFLGQVTPPPCTGGQGNAGSGCNGSAHLAAHPVQTSPFVQNGTPGQFTFPTDASIAVDFGLTNLRVYSTWTGGTNSNPTLWDEPCRTATWGETEDFVVEIYDDSNGSVVGLGNDFSFTPTVCGISQLLGVPGNFTGFRVECTDINGDAIDSKIHFDVTKNSVY